MTKRKRIKVYVAGGSDEPHVAAGFIARLEAEGLEVTFNWPASVLEVRRQGLKEHELTPEQRRQLASDDKAGVQACEVLWLLVPPGKTEGSFWELGHADALEKLCVVSGSHRSRSIFTALSDLHFDDHESAFLFLLDLADGATWSVATPEQAARIERIPVLPSSRAYMLSCLGDGSYQLADLPSLVMGVGLCGTIQACSPVQHFDQLIVAEGRGHGGDPALLLALDSVTGFDRARPWVDAFMRARREGKIEWKEPMELIFDDAEMLVAGDQFVQAALVRAVAAVHPGVRWAAVPGARVVFGAVGEYPGEAIVAMLAGTGPGEWVERPAEPS